MIIHALFFCIKADAQTILTVVPFDNEQREFIISSSSCITFQTDSIAISSRVDNDSCYAFCFFDVQKLFFSEFIPAFIDIVKQPWIVIYPNPTSDILMIKGIIENCNINVYSMEGKEVLNTYYSIGSGINIRSLSSGVYVVKAGNMVGRFVKE